MDILDKIDLFIGEEISGTPVDGSPGTTTNDVAKFTKRSSIINRKRKKSDDDDSEEELRGKERKVKSGSHAIQGLGTTTL